MSGEKRKRGVLPDGQVTSKRKRRAEKKVQWEGLEVWQCPNNRASHLERFDSGPILCIIAKNKGVLEGDRARIVNDLIKVSGEIALGLEKEPKKIKEFTAKEENISFDQLRKKHYNPKRKEYLNEKN